MRNNGLYKLKELEGRNGLWNRRVSLDVKGVVTVHLRKEENGRDFEYLFFTGTEETRGWLESSNEK